jgi:uncharacterized RDD family membrane protein YckC
MTGAPPTPGLGRRLLCLVYETLLLTAVVLFAGGVATLLIQAAGLGYSRILTRAVVIAACAAYFIVQWRQRGQTLPMKTWRIRLESASGERITLPQAWMRLALATLGYLAMGISVLWALADRDRQFLHDRLTGTRLVAIPATS